MPRFVILLHELPAGGARPTHWDFMLEQEETLRTWALSRQPAPGTTTEAVQLADHRAAYLDYEGPVSGNRGTVTRWDRGEYTLEEETERRFAISLAGARLHCRATLTRAARGGHFWSVSFSAEPIRGCSSSSGSS